MDTSIEIIFGAVIALIALIVVFKYATVSKFPYVHRNILTPTELKFFKVLKDLIPDDLCLSVKPRLGDIIDVDRIIKDKDARWIGNYGAAIWSKHIDFVIFDLETAEVILCIELDDASHNLSENKARDVFKNKALKAADIPLIRVKVAAHYSAKALQKQIDVYF